MQMKVQERERVDDLQNGYYLIQNPDHFCYGIDAVLLGWFAKVRSTDRVIDLCTGSGVVPLLLVGRGKGESHIGLELQPEVADMARRSVQGNGLDEKIKIVTGDVREAASIFGGASFDIVTCNPPYMTEHHGLVNPNEPKAVARHELACSLEDVISQSAKLLVPHGKLFLVHRPFRLAEIMHTMILHQLEPKRMQLVYPYIDREPNLVLIEAVRAGRSRITVERPLIIYKQDGSYTADIMKMYERVED